MPHILTAWIHGPLPGFPGVNPRDYVRIWWDPDPDGIHQDYWVAARVHYLPDSLCWRWQAFTSSGARHGHMPRLKNLKAIPIEALERVDSTIELYSIYPRHYSRVFEIKHRYLKSLKHRVGDPPWVPELISPQGYRILRWSADPHPRRDVEERYVRPLVHSRATLAEVSHHHQQGTLVERIHSGSVPAAGISLSRGQWSWRVHFPSTHPSLSGVNETGNTKGPEKAFFQVERMLRFLGASEASTYSPTLQDVSSPSASLEDVEAES